MGVGGGFLGSFGGGFLVEERLPVGHRDLIIIGMDFVEGEEAVPVAAVIDEGSLQRRLHARHLGEIDVAAQKFAGGALVVEFLYAAVTQYDDPGLLRMRRIDKHFVVGHLPCSFARRLGRGPVEDRGPLSAIGMPRARVCDGVDGRGVEVVEARRRSPAGLAGRRKPSALTSAAAFDVTASEICILGFENLVCRSGTRKARTLTGRFNWIRCHASRWATGTR